jgi:hypothetical protein
MFIALALLLPAAVLLWKSMLQPAPASPSAAPVSTFEYWLTVRGSPAISGERIRIRRQLSRSAPSSPFPPTRRNAPFDDLMVVVIDVPHWHV